MKHKAQSFLTLGLFLVFSFATGYAFADNSVVTPQDFFAEVLQTISNFGGLTWVLKIASIITIVIASMKVSVLNQWFWSKLGNFQAWLAPILGLVVGILSLTVNGGSITLSSVFAYLSAGAGAIILHELLDTIKAIPGLGSIYVEIINVIENALGGPASR